jgi:hypothetical protein
MRTKDENERKKVRREGGLRWSKVSTMSYEFNYED